MLRKLIKYDLKALTPVLAVIHAFLLLLAVFLRLFFTGRIFREGFDFNEPQNAIAAFIIIILFALTAAVIAFASEFFIAARYYKNLFSDKGYLTLTLPVTPGQHLLSKTISGTVWGFLDLCLVFLATYITFATPYVRECVLEGMALMWNEFAFMGDFTLPSPTVIVLFFIIFSIIGVMANIIMFYASVAAGQAIFGHRLLGAVAAYFVLNTIVSLLTIIVLMLSGSLSIMFVPETFNPLNL